MKNTGRSRKEAGTGMRSLADSKRRVKIGGWKIGTLYSIGKTAQLVAEVKNYRIVVLRVGK